MTTLTKPESSSHYYTQSGEPAYDATLREARKELLFPSVTTVLQILSKPQLESWKVNQAILSALTLPRLHNEPEDAYAKRVIEDSKQHSIKAAEFGTRIHKGIEAKLIGIKTEGFDGIIENAGEIWDWLDIFVNWANENISKVRETEKILVNPSMGYAGKTDCICEFRGKPSLLDFKTQGVKNGKPAFYDEWCYQLAAYRFAQDESLDIVSVVIDSNKPGIIEAKVWTQEEMLRGWEIFKCALNLWKLTKKYDPTGAVR